MKRDLEDLILIQLAQVIARIQQLEIRHTLKKLKANVEKSKRSFKRSESTRRKMREAMIASWKRRKAVKSAKTKRRGRPSQSKRP